MYLITLIFKYDINVTFLKGNIIMFLRSYRSMTEMLYKYQSVLYYYILLLHYVCYYKGFLDVYHCILELVLNVMV